MSDLTLDEMPREKLLAFRGFIVTALCAQQEFQAFVTNVLPGIANVRPASRKALIAANRQLRQDARATTKALDKILKAVDRKVVGKASLFDLGSDPVKTASGVMDKLTQEYAYLETLQQADSLFADTKHSIKKRIEQELPDERGLKRTDWTKRKAAEVVICREEVTKFHKAHPGLFATADDAETHYMVLSGVARDASNLVSKHKGFVDKFAQETRQLSKDGGFTALVTQDNTQDEGGRSAAIA